MKKLILVVLFLPLMLHTSCTDDGCWSNHDREVCFENTGDRRINITIFDDNNEEVASLQVGKQDSKCVSLELGSYYVEGLKNGIDLFPNVLDEDFTLDDCSSDELWFTISY